MPRINGERKLDPKRLSNPSYVDESLVVLLANLCREYKIEFDGKHVFLWGQHLKDNLIDRVIRVCIVPIEEGAEVIEQLQKLGMAPGLVPSTVLEAVKRTLHPPWTKPYIKMTLTDRMTGEHRNHLIIEAIVQLHRMRRETWDSSRIWYLIKTYPTIAVDTEYSVGFVPDATYDLTTTLAPQGVRIGADILGEARQIVVSGARG